MLGLEGQGDVGGQGSGVARVGAAGGGVGPGSALKAAERKEEAAKISRWEDKEEIIVRLITNGLEKGEKNENVPRK